MVLSQVKPSLVSVVQLARSNYEKSKCSRRCSCRGNNVVYTELCKCGGKVTAVQTLHHEWLAKI